eukprot:2248647-Pleurochrysis_carterae.AAC.1
MTVPKSQHACIGYLPLQPRWFALSRRVDDSMRLLLAGASEEHRVLPLRVGSSAQTVSLGSHLVHVDRCVGHYARAGILATRGPHAGKHARLARSE